jgi:glutathione S-transferase
LLDPAGVRQRCASIAKLYDLVRSRPIARPYLEGAERMAEDYAALMRKNPAGVIA